jgi:hypothetical protein
VKSAPYEASGQRAGRWLITSFLVGLGWPAAAQQAPVGWALKITPQYVVVSGLWLEAERARAAHPSQTFTLGAQLYAGPTGRPDVPFDPSAQPSRAGIVRGAGVLAQHRFYWPRAAGQPAVPTGLYLGYGPTVQFFHLGFARNGWHEETSPTGAPYLVYGSMRHYENVLRYGATVQAGYQWALAGRVLLDLYAGVGLRRSHYWSAIAESQFQSGPSDYAHEGVYFPAGFKVGIAL